MTKVAIEEFHKNKNKKDENKSLLSKSPAARNEAREEISQSQNIVRLEPETLEIRPSMKEVDEIFVNQDLNQTPAVNRRLRLEIDITEKSKNQHIVDTQTPVQMQIDSPVLDENKKVDDFRRRVPMRIATGGSQIQHSPQIRSLRSGIQSESKPHLTEYDFHEA